MRLPGRQDIHLEKINLANEGRSGSSAPASASAMSPSSSAGITPQPVRPKPKKKMTISDEFIAADLQWYQDKHSAQMTSVSGSTTVLQPTVSPATDGDAPKGTLDSGSAQLKACDTEVPTPALAPAVASTSPEMDIPPTQQEESKQALEEALGRTEILTPVATDPTVTRVSEERPPFSPAPGAVSPTPEQKISNDDASCEVPPPSSPVILSASLKRRRSPTEPEPGREVARSPTPSTSSAPARETLPSPLSSKRPRKHRKGPPGLKFLPVLVPPEPVLQESEKANITASSDGPSTQPTSGASNSPPTLLAVEALTQEPAPVSAVLEPSRKPTSPPSSAEPHAVVAQDGQPATDRPNSMPPVAVLEDTVHIADSPEPMEVDDGEDSYEATVPIKRETDEREVDELADDFLTREMTVVPSGVDAVPQNVATPQNGLSHEHPAARETTAPLQDLPSASNGLKATVDAPTDTLRAESAVPQRSSPIPHAADVKESELMDTTPSGLFI